MKHDKALEERANALADERYPHTPAPLGEHHLVHRARTEADRGVYASGYYMGALDCRPALEKACRALEEFQLGHVHAPDLPHTRALGETYGWCDFCQTKVEWGPGLAEVTLAYLKETGNYVPAKEGE